MENNKTQAVVESTNNVDTTETKKVSNKKFKKNSLPAYADRIPSHIIDLALIIHNNAEIRRFTALGIIKHLTKTGEIKGNSRYVAFKWNKFSVKCNGLIREYTYNEPFFLNALVASFTSFAKSAQATIDEFARKEMNLNINEAVDSKQVEEIVNETNSDTEVEVSAE